MNVEFNETKREEILAAAEVEFTENGFGPASMDRISARAGASKRTVYRYFESKELLFRALIERHWGRCAESLVIDYDPDQPIRDQLRALGEAEGRLLTSPEIMATNRMVMTELLRTPELAGETIEKTDFTASFEAMIRNAAADGQLDVDDPREAAEEFIGLIKSKAFWPVILGAPIVGEAEMVRIIDRSVDMMLSRYSSAG